MAKNSAANLLTSVDSLFTTQAERDIAGQPRVQEIPIDQIDDFPNHPFKVRMDDNMIEMAESVKQHGILVPAIVRPKENGHYEMVAGHRRKLACTLIAKLHLPCIVRELTDEEATIIMVDSNLQREQLLPSEKAFAYEMKLDAMRRQAGRPPKENSVPLGHHFIEGKSREILAANSPDSNTQIQRYIRLTELIPEVLDLVDNSVLKEKDKLQIALRPAVELSYLTQQEQHDLYETMITEDCTPSHVQAMKMRKFSEEGRLNMDVIFSIMQEEKPNQKELNKDEGVYYVVDHVTDKAEATHFVPVKTADSKGKIVVKGLEDDAYTLTEVRTDSGYVLLKQGIDVVISQKNTDASCAIYGTDVLGLIQNDPWYASVIKDNGDLHNMPQKHLEHKLLTASANVDGKKVNMVEDNGSINAEAPLTVVNTSGFDLPQTGDHGTWMFTVGGIVLMASDLARDNLENDISFADLQDL